MRLHGNITFIDRREGLEDCADKAAGGVSDVPELSPLLKEACFVSATERNAGKEGHTRVRDPAPLDAFSRLLFAAFFLVVEAAFAGVAAIVRACDII